MEKKITAKNGIEIYSYKNPTLHGFSISLFLRAGLMYERYSEQGITHFLEHVLIRNINKQRGASFTPPSISTALNLTPPPTPKWCSFTPTAQAPALP